jgi:decaprenylphospho-beta-D-erythro-pentofuranosid-2-ulose 2-reductase
MAVVRELLSGRRYTAVTLAGRPSNELNAAHDELRDTGHQTHVLSYHADFSESATRDVICEARERMGGLDVVVVALGYLSDHPGSSASPAESELHEVLVANLVGPALVANTAVDVLAEQRNGTLVVLTSVAAVRTRDPILGYCAAKRALDELVRGLAVRAARFGVSCVVVRPGRVRTRMSAGVAPVPFTVQPLTVARQVRRAVDTHRGVVWSPPLLRPLTAVLRMLPTRLLPKGIR